MYDVQFYDYREEIQKYTGFDGRQLLTIPKEVLN